MAGIKEHPASGIAGLKDPNGRVDALMVNSPINDYTGIARPDTEQLPAFGLAHIATEAERAGFNIGVVDAEALALSPEKAAEIINKANPRFVGINMLTPTFPLAREIVRRLSPDIKLAAGGAHAKAMPREILQDREFSKRDTVLALEDGEYIFRGLLEGVGPDEMGGVAYIDPRNGEVVEVRSDAANKWIPKDLDGLAIADRKFLPGDPFQSQGRVETHMVGSRGCPFNCRFCAGAREQLLFGVRNRTPGSLVHELGQLRDKGMNAVRFIDDLFLANKKRMEGFSTAMKETGLDRHFVWDATGRVNTISRMPEDMLLRIAMCGAREISVGVESANQRVLDVYDKDTNPEMVRETVRKLARVGIRTKAYFILGAPTETEEEMRETVNFMGELRQLARDEVRKNPHTPSGAKNIAQCRGSMFEFRPYPGTALFDFITGKRPYPEHLLQAGANNYRYPAQTVIHSFAPVFMEGLEERQKHNYTTNLPFSEVEPRIIQEFIADAMTRQREDMERHGEYLPGVTGKTVFSREVESK